VVSSTFFVCYKADKKIIGMANIHHTLNDFLLDYGRHIGFGVHPLEQRKGYATQILNMALEYAKKLSLAKLC